MRVNGIGELKRTLVEVILIYLIVDFATDIAESEGHLSWTTLVMPLSILLIAGSLRLMGGSHPRPELVEPGLDPHAEPPRRNAPDGEGSGGSPQPLNPAR